MRDFCKDLSLCPRGHTFRRAMTSGSMSGALLKRPTRRSSLKGPGRIWDWTGASNGVCLENFSLNCFGLAVELF